jgi:hypothetical protein
MHERGDQKVGSSRLRRQWREIVDRACFLFPLRVEAARADVHALARHFAGLSFHVCARTC